MYARDASTPATVTVPPPRTDSPAAGTTGAPAAMRGRGDGRLTAEDLPVPVAVVAWAVGGLAVVVLARVGLKNGGVA